MSVFSEHDKRFEGIEHRTGLFLAIAALIVLATLITFLVKHDTFTPTMRVNFYAQSAQGIRKGMSVQLSGFKIGTVQQLGIEPDARVKVVLAIERKYAGLVPEDSEVGLSKEGLIGASFIEIEPGNNKTRSVAEDGVLTFYRAIDFADMAKELQDKMDPILDDVRKATQSLNDPEGDVRKALVNIRRATALVAELAQQVSQLAKHSESKVDAIAGKVDHLLDQTGSTLDRAHAALDTAAHTLTSVDAQLPGLLLRLDQSLKNVEAITSDTRRLASSLTEDLPSAIHDGRALVEDTHEIIEGAKKAWPLRNWVPPATQKSLPLDSYDGRGEGVR